jgi:hypothetical protein
VQKYSSTVEVMKHLEQKYNMGQHPLKSNRKKVSKRCEMETRPSQITKKLSIPIKKIVSGEISETVIQSPIKVKKQCWVEDRDDLELAELIEHSVLKKESDHKNEYPATPAKSESDDNNLPFELAEKTRHNVGQLYA